MFYLKAVQGEQEWQGAMILLFDFYQTVKFERTLSIFLIFAATSFRVWVALKFAFISSNNSEKPSSFGRFLFKIWVFSRLSILFIELSNVTGAGRAKFLKIEKSKSAFISSKLSRRRDSFLQIWSSGLNSILGTVRIRKLGVLQGKFKFRKTLQDAKSGYPHMIFYIW